MSISRARGLNCVLLPASPTKAGLSNKKHASAGTPRDGCCVQRHSKTHCKCWSFRKYVRSDYIISIRHFHAIIITSKRTGCMEWRYAPLNPINYSTIPLIHLSALSTTEFLDLNSELTIGPYSRPIKPRGGVVWQTTSPSKISYGTGTIKTASVV